MKHIELCDTCHNNENLQEFSQEDTQYEVSTYSTSSVDSMSRKLSKNGKGDGLWKGRYGERRYQTMYRISKNTMANDAYFWSKYIRWNVLLCLGLILWISLCAMDVFSNFVLLKRQGAFVRTNETAKAITHKTVHGNSFFADFWENIWLRIAQILYIHPIIIIFGIFSLYTWNNKLYKIFNQLLVFHTCKCSDKQKDINLMKDKVDSQVSLENNRNHDLQFLVDYRHDDQISPFFYEFMKYSNSPKPLSENLVKSSQVSHTNENVNINFQSTMSHKSDEGTSLNETKKDEFLERFCKTGKSNIDTSDEKNKKKCALKNSGSSKSFKCNLHSFGENYLVQFNVENYLSINHKLIGEYDSLEVLTSHYYRQLGRCSNICFFYNDYKRGMITSSPEFQHFLANMQRYKL